MHTIDSLSYSTSSNTTSPVSYSGASGAQSSQSPSQHQGVQSAEIIRDVEATVGKMSGGGASHIPGSGSGGEGAASGGVMAEGQSGSGVEVIVEAVTAEALNANMLHLPAGNVVNVIILDF